MLGKLLQPTDLERINKCSDLEAVISLLRQTDYGVYLEGIKASLLSPRRIEYEIRKKISSAFSTVLRCAPGYTKPLINQAFLLYEVDNLKAVLRGIEISESWEMIRYMLFPMQDYPSLPYESICKSGNIPAALEILKDTSYYRVLELAMGRYHEESSLFPLEVALDLDYWKKVWRAVNELPPSDRNHAREIVGLLIDKNNLTWAARYRLYHHMTEEEIINYTLPFGHRIGDDVIRTIASGGLVIDVVRQAYPELSESLAGELEPALRLPFVELQLTRIFLDRCRKAFTANTFHVGFLLAYLFLLEIEIQDVTLIVESKALGLQQGSYESYLINPLGPDLRRNPLEVKV